MFRGNQLQRIRPVLRVDDPIAVDVATVSRVPQHIRRTHAVHVAAGDDQDAGNAADVGTLQS